ncbi:branched-chain amino acid ABC transporter substrate-binding protein [Pandoraea terrae]|uniref:Branched-chain amino acid ABC transporter substrate-binding protein n=1 Tax=Pandoraea terrae TaxID=1537710 RepID=A0A5E4ZBT0_9BURK|nr:branched-chain amino acid ABC transporter substrate-binding protein [Pandoraea terrae]
MINFHKKHCLHSYVIYIFPFLLKSVAIVDDSTAYDQDLANEFEKTAR